jgi:hypothetical protein
MNWILTTVESQLSQTWRTSRGSVRHLVHLPLPRPLAHLLRVKRLAPAAVRVRRPAGCTPCQARLNRALIFSVTRTNEPIAILGMSIDWRSGWEA